MDCGRQAPDQLTQEGIAWHDIAGQIVTHVHGDHVYGMEDFAFVRYYESTEEVLGILHGGPRPKLIAHSAVLQELWECLAPSLRYLQDGDGAHLAGTLEHYFDPVPAFSAQPPVGNSWPHSESFSAGQLLLVARESQHVPGKPTSSLELQITWSPGRDRKAESCLSWWSGDSLVDTNYLYDIAERASILFHDCTFSENSKAVHGHIDEIASLPRNIREKMVLMHHEDDIEDHRKYVEDLGMRLAMPGDEFDLTSGERISTDGRSSE